MDNSPQPGQGVPPTLPLDMATWITWILNTVKLYGLPFVLLAVAVWYFHQRTEKLETAIEACQKKHLETVTQQNGALVRALEQNTQALTRLETTITRR